jgi:4'-phosphopantetheinyl transferase
MEWTDRRTELSLPPGEVQLWRINLSDFRTRISEFQQVLSKNEHSRAARFVRVADQEKYIIGRAILRQLLSKYLKTSLAAIEIESNEFGKPFVPKILNQKDIRFNLSHSGNLCVVGFRQQGEIGVDIEKIRDNLATDDLARRYFSPCEVTEFARLPDAERRLGFFLCWTRKEAYVKALGDGLQRPLDEFSMTLTPGEAPKLNSADSGRWMVLSFDPGAGYVGAVVTEKELSDVTYCNYRS